MLPKYLLPIPGPRLPACLWVLDTAGPLCYALWVGCGCCRVDYGLLARRGSTLLYHLLMSSAQQTDYAAPRQRETWVLWGAVLLWMAVIFFFSSQGSLGDTKLPSFFKLLRKIGHVVEYWILAVLLGRALLHTWQSRGGALGRSLLLRAWWVGVTVSALYAITDEVHQTFVPRRYGNPGDVLLDTLSAVAGLGVWYILRVRQLRSRRVRLEGVESSGR